MKHLLLAAGLLASLTSCGTQDSDPTHVAVTAYIKKNLGDPDSYQSVRWGATHPITRQDSARLAALHLMKSGAHQEREQGYKLMDELPKTDSVREIGVSLTHAFRAKNKLGALVLDSTDYAVYRDGQVRPL